MWRRQRVASVTKELWELVGGLMGFPPGYILGPCPLLVLRPNTNHRACAPAVSSAQKVPPVGFMELAPCH